LAFDPEKTWSFSSSVLMPMAAGGIAVGAGGAEDLPEKLG
jgi:hypothetical protein